MENGDWRKVLVSRRPDGLSTCSVLQPSQQTHGMRESELTRIADGLPSMGWETLEGGCMVRLNLCISFSFFFSDGFSRQQGAQ